jgi:hypothetical protein
MDSKIRSSHSSDSFHSKLHKSTVFDATIEQSRISMQASRPRRENLNLQREPINLRSSSTFSSTIFAPPLQTTPKSNSLKPHDNITLDYFGNDPSDFYRKSVVSDFIPNFQPQFVNATTWKVDNSTFKPVTPQKENKENWIRPITKAKIQKPEYKIRISDYEKEKKGKVLSYKSSISSAMLIRSTRATSKASSKKQSRAVTPVINYYDQNCDLARLNTEENSTRFETEPDFGCNKYELVRLSSQTNGKQIITPLRNLNLIKVSKKERNSIDYKNGNLWETLRSSKNIENEKENNEAKNYQLILDAWKENRLSSRFAPSLKQQPGYMRKTISSLSKSKNIM